VSLRDIGILPEDKVVVNKAADAKIGKWEIDAKPSRLWLSVIFYVTFRVIFFNVANGRQPGQITMVA
jgi:hypothetical protein